MSLNVRDCWFLSGPTASGKTAVGLELAQRIGAEIISLDSMALYRGMDIGTAKPTLAERATVPHHLIDILEPDQDFSLAQYVAAAEGAAAEIAARGRQVLFVGGTPLYLKALLRGIFVGPPANWPLRRELAALAKSQGSETLHERLAAVDRRTAERLHPADTRRIIRALEVWDSTGQSITELQQQFDRARPADSCRVVVLDWPRDELYQRINLRVESMFSQGFIDEVAALATRYPQLGRTASQAVGYQEVAAYLHGERDRQATMDLVAQRTRQFAKRQGTWFRSLSECRPIPLSGSFDIRSVANSIATTSTAGECPGKTGNKLR